jgi:hypothetical protein
MMTAIIGQTLSSFNFRWMMDQRKILLCDLAKGSIGDDNSKLLGSLIVLKEKLSAFSRQDVRESERAPQSACPLPARFVQKDSSQGTVSTCALAFPPSGSYPHINKESLYANSCRSLFYRLNTQAACQRGPTKLYARAAPSARTWPKTKKEAVGHGRTVEIFAGH